MVYYLINFAGNLLEWFINISFFSTLHIRRFSRNLTLLIGALLTIIQFVNTSFLLANTPLLSLCAILYSILLSCLYKTKWYWHLLESLLVFIIIAAPEALFGIVSGLFLNVDFETTHTNPFLFALGTLATKFISVFIVKYIRLGKIHKSIQASGRVVIPVLLLPVATFFVMIALVKSGYVLQDTSFLLLALFSICLLSLANLVIFWIIERQGDYIRTKQALHFAQSHIQSQINHYTELYNYQEETRRFRHDIKHKFLVLSGLLQSKDLEAAQELVSGELLYAEASSSQIIDSGNPVIDAILQSKQNIAASKKISLFAKIQLEERIRINELEFGVLLGNVVDNALEAAEKIAGENEPEILVELRSMMGRILLSVTNPTVEESGPASSLPSTKQDTRNHGLGLRSIRSIAEKHDGTLSILWQNHQFQIKIGLSNID